jgi:hypothetical protein
LDGGRKKVVEKGEENSGEIEVEEGKRGSFSCGFYWLACDKKLAEFQAFKSKLESS